MSLTNFVPRCEALILSQAEFLRSRQVSMPTLELAPDETISAIPLSIGHLDLSARKLAGGWELSSGLGWERVKMGVPLRLPLTWPIDNTEYNAPTQSAGLRAKLRRYGSYSDLHLRLPTFAVTTLRRKLQKRPDRAVDKLLAKTSGLTFVALEKDSRLRLTCLDDGGLFDMNLNTEGDSYPWQVPVGYYSTEYAAYVFAWLAHRTGDAAWRDAARQAFAFSLRNLKPYTAISFDHYEFKLMPLLLLLRNFGAETVSDLPLNALLDNLRYDERNYEPVNVACMRIANLSLFDSLAPNPSYKKRAQMWLRTVMRNTTSQGQIQDNFKPASLHNHDLTYHQFSIACLKLALSSRPESWTGPLADGIASAFEAGLAFSNALRRPDGHPSFMGRGCNNIYHIASYLYAASESVCPTRISDSLALLEAHDDLKQGWPSALNTARETRMGWNHCAIPYIGQSLFFLALTQDTLVSEKPPPSSRSSALKRGAFACFEHNGFHAVAYAGGDSYFWSGGAHATGMAGLASLSYYGIPLLGALEYNAADGMWFTDIPIGATTSPNGVFRHRLKQNDDRQASITGPFGAVSYEINESGFVLRVRLHRRKDAVATPLLSFRQDMATLKMESPQRARLTLRDNLALNCDIEAESNPRLHFSKARSNSFGPVQSLLFSVDGQINGWALRLTPVTCQFRDTFK